MTTPLPATAVTSILLPDNQWYGVAPGSLTLFANPEFPLADGSGMQDIGGMWVTWADSGGVFYAAPSSSILPVQWTPPQVGLVTATASLAGPLDTLTIYEILLPGGLWVSVAPGELALFPDPQFDMADGTAPETIGGDWLVWPDTAAQWHGTPVDRGLPCKWTPP